MNWCQLTNLPKYLKESYFAGTRLANKLFGAISQRQIFVWWFLLIACQNILQKGVRANLKSHFNLESQGFTLLFLNTCWASFGTWHFGKKHFGTDICVSIDVSGLCMFWLRRHVAQGCYGTGKFWCSNTGGLRLVQIHLKSDWKWKWQSYELGISWPFTVIFLPTTLITSAKLRI